MKVEEKENKMNIKDKSEQKIDENDQKRNRRIIEVALLTPYLTLGPSDFPSGSLKVEIERYGYNSQNFKDVERIITPEFCVLINKSQRFYHDLPIKGDLVIAGSAEDSEEVINRIHGSGLIVARYSIFYGGNSRYTNQSPAQGGYALDIPKNHGTVEQFLNNDKMLDALITRDEKKIRSALDGLNATLAQPILATSYLSEALEIRL